ncbi:MAG: M20/M25/M40 family metallo-hydrolase, partial [Deltaproteobacteria bacterium]|nr:M20/M25/M40 family metallo-hydrolase [Deltaproteobacteria bacterium]
YSITERYSPAMKTKWRAFWRQFFEGLGLTVTEMPYTTAHSNGETQGHNLEAVLPGKSTDSVVIIVHYDSIGPFGQETLNPGVDDDMTGMSMMLELARLLVAHPGQLKNTVRFVAVDYEEWGSPGLEGSRVYAQYLKALATANHFNVIAAIDNEQSGWNCGSDAYCPASEAEKMFDIYSFSCSGTVYNYSSTLGNQFVASAAKYGTLATRQACMDQASDHYAMWEIGVPSLNFGEHDMLANPHFDHLGNDTYDRIDLP